MPVSPELLEILVCPETRQSVSSAGTDTIHAVNDKIKAGSLRNRGGEAVPNPIEEGLVREDGKIDVLNAQIGPKLFEVCAGVCADFAPHPPRHAHHPTKSGGPPSYPLPTH